jgi:hypothetical protein
MRVPALVAALLALLTSGAGAQASTPPGLTYGEAGTQAVAALLHDYYGGNGLWNVCDAPSCGQDNQDWGADDLTYALYLRWETTRDPSVPPVMSALAATAPAYGPPCELPSCSSWSDVPQWDSIAASREAEVLGGDAQALAKAEGAFAFVQDANAYALGACPDVRYQQPSGGGNKLKTLESDGNAIKAAILLYQETNTGSYLQAAEMHYAAVRLHFLDPKVPLYTTYVFDDGTSCSQLPHRFFASVNGDMIWSGLELARITGVHAYLQQALATARAVATDLNDPAGVFADLQAENDVVEPLVEAMYGLAAQQHVTFARTWILTNATAALTDRAADGAFGRFFDGPAPTTTVTQWQTAGGFALEIAAAGLDPNGIVRPVNRWAGAKLVTDTLGPTGTVTFTGSEIAFYGTLGAKCCEAGHARVFVDGRETFDRTGIWQDKSSAGISIPNTVLFAWRWPRPGRHTISFAPGIPNGKEGGSFLALTGYLTGSTPP